MNSALESTLAVGALTLVLAVVLVSGGGGGGKARPLQAEDSPAQARLLAREGRPPAGPLAAERSTAPLPPQPLQSVSSGRRGGGAHKLLLNL
jgi:hypothetical protein